VTYDMNVLMALPAPVRFLVTMNRSDDVDPASVLRSFAYEHPVYTPRAVAAQRRHTEISGANRTFYAGAYWGAGFHEDGLVSGYRAATAIERWAAQPLRGATAPLLAAPVASPACA
jgi:predicted NAD/FAD-binding protein